MANGAHFDSTAQGEDSAFSVAPTERALGLTVLFSYDRALIGRTIEANADLTIGREGEAVDVPLRDARVSRRHALLSFKAPGRKPLLEDQDSRNGTFVNGERIKQHELVAGTIIRIGDCLFEFGPIADPETDPADSGRASTELVGRSPLFIEMLELIDRLSPTELAVLIMGETGTGKELVARRLHERSGRQGALVAVNCAAIPEHLVESTLFGHKKGAFTGATQDTQGCFGQAHNGTLFLDEVSELPATMQAKLLRVLESREYAPVGAGSIVTTNARIISATNCDLRTESSLGRFRPDLFARLQGFIITPPPLRKRRSDIPLLVEHFFAMLLPSAPPKYTAGFMERLLVNDWPLNVRELRTILERLLVVAHGVPALRSEHLSAVLFEAKAHPTLDLSIETPSKEALEAALRECHGKIVLVAQRFQRQRGQVYRWLERYGIDPTSFRANST
jgi:DNA-binding NtrC family response regulator